MDACMGCKPWYCNYNTNQCMNCAHQKEKLMPTEYNEIKTEIDYLKEEIEKLKDIIANCTPYLPAASGIERDALKAIGETEGGH